MEQRHADFNDPDQIAAPVPLIARADEHPALVIRPWERDRVLSLRMAEDQEQRSRWLAKLQIWIDVAWWVLCCGFYGSIISAILLMSPWIGEGDNPAGIGAWFYAYRHAFLPSLGLCLITIVASTATLTRFMERAKSLGVELQPRSNPWKAYVRAPEDPRPDGPSDADQAS